MKMHQLARYYHTLKYLKPIQIYGQVLYRFRGKPKIKNHLPPPTWQRHCCSWQSFVPKYDRLLSSSRIVCLNQEGDITRRTVWHDTTKSRLWLYHLHYFHYLPGINRALEGVAKELLCRFIKENPPHSQPGWEPYPLSLRIVNWIKYFLEGRDEPTDTILNSLWQQTSYLAHYLEIHILGNHLLANAKALIFAGLYFKKEKWLSLGIKLFSRQLNEQILADGGHFELSPMYHAIIFEDLLDIMQLCHCYDYQYPNRWFAICEKMNHWLAVMCHPDGQYAFFNDTAHNLAATHDELKTYYLHLLENKEFPLLKSKPFIDDQTDMTQYLKESGYCRIAHGNMVLIADIAEVGARYQPGHAHADTLSFELSIGLARVFVNSGISTYEDGEKRLLERSTAAHNTVVVNDENSSDVWKSFRVGLRAHVHDVLLKAKTLRATHDGYYRRFKITHTRTWQFSDRSLVIQDELKGKGKHKINIIFHLHPDIKIKPLSDHEFLLKKENVAIAHLMTSHAAKILTGTYHPGFNITLANQKIIIETIDSLPKSFCTTINCLQD